MKSKRSASELKLLSNQFFNLSIFLAVFLAFLVIRGSILFGEYDLSSLVVNLDVLFGCFSGVVGISIVYFVMLLPLFFYYSLAKPADDINSKTERKENEK